MNDLDFIILCGGKCGSTTLYNTLKNNQLKGIKVHNIQDFIFQFKYDGLLDSIKLSAEKKKLSNEKLIIIDSYRKPIERKISSFFENLKTHVPNYLEKSCNELINIFNSKYVNTIEEYHSIDDIMKILGINSFKKFDFTKKYVIKENDNIIFVKLLFDDINNWAKIISKLFNKNIELHSSNLSRNKPIFKLYKEFKCKYKVPKSYIKNILLQDKIFQFYNSEIEQNKYIKYWLNRSF